MDMTSLVSPFRNIISLYEHHMVEAMIVGLAVEGAIEWINRMTKDNFYLNFIWKAIQVLVALVILNALFAIINAEINTLYSLLP